MWPWLSPNGQNVSNSCLHTRVQRQNKKSPTTTTEGSLNTKYYNILASQLKCTATTTNNSQDYPLLIHLTNPICNVCHTNQLQIYSTNTI